MRRASFYVLFLLAACGDGGAIDGDAGPGDAERPVDCGTCAPLALEVSVPRMDGTSVVVADGAALPWVHGFQGGTMITPVLHFDPAQVAAGEDVDVTFTHAEDPAAPSALGEVSLFPSYHVRVTAYDDHGVPAAGPFSDQLGWLGLDGVRMTLSVTAIAGTRSGTRGATVSLVADTTMHPVPHECDAFPATGMGCEYRTATGTATVVLTATMPGDATCPDGRNVRIDFAPDLAADACAMAILGAPIQRVFHLSAGGYAPSASCLDSLGITSGMTVPATVRFETRGTCQPVILDDVPALDLSSCTCM